MARKYYPYQVDKQPKQVQSYVKSHWGALEDYGDTARGAIAPDPAHHRMTAAKGPLKKAWKTSKDKAVKNKSALKNAAKKAKSAKGAKQVIMRNHFVKFGADPDHK